MCVFVCVSNNELILQIYPNRDELDAQQVGSHVHACMHACVCYVHTWHACACACACMCSSGCSSHVCLQEKTVSRRAPPVHRRKRKAETPPSYEGEDTPAPEKKPRQDVPEGQSFCAKVYILLYFTFPCRNQCNPAS